MTNTRRQFVKTTAAGLGLLTLPELLTAQPAQQATKNKIVCVGGHPDDPESAHYDPAVLAGAGTPPPGGGDAPTRRDG